MSDFAKLHKRISELENQLATSIVFTEHNGLHRWHATLGVMTAIGTTKLDALLRLARRMEFEAAERRAVL